MLKKFLFLALFFVPAAYSMDGGSGYTMTADSVSPFAYPLCYLGSGSITPEQAIAEIKDLLQSRKRPSGIDVESVRLALERIRIGTPANEHEATLEKAYQEIAQLFGI